MEQLIQEILREFGLSEVNDIEKIGSGHINRTFLVSAHVDEKFILQEVNTHVFRLPHNIDRNLKKISKYLETSHPDYLFPVPLPTLNGKTMVERSNTYWRVLPFVHDGVAHETLSDPVQAYEAAKQFGKFSRLLNSFPINELQPTIPNFHDLNLRLQQFDDALINTTSVLKEIAADTIQDVREFRFIADYFNSFLRGSDLPDRVMHHDTKISNVLLDKLTAKGICVIDLDTVMPGKFISDLGDMMRTYVCAFSENETDLSKLNLRLDYFEATIEGYLSEMGTILTQTEKDLILFSGKYMIYMQALRFLTDHLNGNIYYPVNYPTLNLDRAKNQFKLLKAYFTEEKMLQAIIDKALAV